MEVIHLLLWHKMSYFYVSVYIKKHQIIGVWNRS